MGTTESDSSKIKASYSILQASVLSPDHFLAVACVRLQRELVKSLVQNKKMSERNTLRKMKCDNTEVMVMGIYSLVLKVLFMCGLHGTYDICPLYLFHQVFPINHVPIIFKNVNPE